MGGNYEKSIYNQLMEVMERLVSVEKELKNEKKEYKNEVIKLNEKIPPVRLDFSIIKEILGTQI